MTSADFTPRELAVLLQALAYGSIEQIYETADHRSAKVLMGRLRDEVAAIELASSPPPPRGAKAAKTVKR